MSSNVGLSTPRGSGTSGYVQKNWAHLRPRDHMPRPNDFDHLKAHKQRQPDASILEHNRKREIEVKCLELQDLLEEEEKLSEDEIAEKVEELRKKLTAEFEAGGGRESERRDARWLKPHQVHELAAAKLAESERLRNALGIRLDYEEGSHWRRQAEEKEKRQRRETEEERPSRRRSASPEY